MDKSELRKANRAFHAQKRMAKFRGIEFTFTEEEWIDLWIKSGVWHLRGRKRGQYVMARKGPDIGPYSKDNVEIKLSEENHSENKNVGRKRKLK